MKRIFIFFMLWAAHAMAADVTWYQQQVENAQPTQDALAQSEKLLREHQDLTIQDTFAVPVFHKQSGEQETAPESFCRTCHLPLPHQKSVRTRTFNNMHVRYVACETCHLRRPDRESEAVIYRWFDMRKRTRVLPEAHFLRSGSDIDNAIQRPNYLKVAPFLDDKRLFLLKDDAFAKDLAAQWKSANTAQKITLHAKIHAPLNWQKGQNTQQGTPCQACHTDKKPMIDLPALGASAAQIQAISSQIIARFLAHYKHDDERMTLREMLQ